MGTNKSSDLLFIAPDGKRTQSLRQGAVVAEYGISKTGQLNRIALTELEWGSAARWLFCKSPTFR